MPRRDDHYHGGSGWRFSWRADRLQALHELGQAFELTEDSHTRPEPAHRADDEQPRPPVEPERKPS